MSSRTSESKPLVAPQLKRMWSRMPTSRYTRVVVLLKSSRFTSRRSLPNLRFKPRSLTSKITAPRPTINRSSSQEKSRELTRLKCRTSRWRVWITRVELLPTTSSRCMLARTSRSAHTSVGRWFRVRDTVGANLGGLTISTEMAQFNTFHRSPRASQTLLCTTTSVTVTRIGRNWWDKATTATRCPSQRTQMWSQSRQQPRSTLPITALVLLYRAITHHSIRHI